MFLIRILLFPFAVLYDGVTGFRNRLYDLKVKPSVSFDVPVICVGNLSVGGTGKTPMIEYLIRLLGDKRTVAVLSRGYQRKTKGFRMATSEDSAQTLGDEPYQLFKKYGAQIKVAVGEDRAMAIPSILQAEENVDVILMDDGFQHRRVKPGFSIVLTDFSKPFYKDFLLPAGRLRESRDNINRANAIVVTKCPAKIDDQLMETIKNEIKGISEKPVFFSRIKYGMLVPFGNPTAAIHKKAVLLTGIANPTPLHSFVSLHHTVVAHLNFPDHHDYSTSDLEKVESIVKQESSVIIITTEKDMVKLADRRFDEFRSTLPFFYLPIEAEFVKDGKEFDELVLQSILQGDQ